MAIFSSLDDARFERPQVVTIGVFDGVHLGHQYLIHEANALARQLSAQVTAVTFWPHPLAILRPDRLPHYLMTLEEKVQTLAATEGVDHVVVLPFTSALSQQSATDFLALLRARIPLAGMAEGADFTLGHNREGTIDWLMRYGAEHGIVVKRIERQTEQALPISSSRIRELVASGDVRLAAHLLSRPFEVRGEIVHGDARGRTLGYPTANFATDPLKLLPANGVYATIVWRKAQPDLVWQGAASIGVRPVFQGQERRLEIYLLDMSEDLYGDELVAAFITRLRDEMNFSSVQQLIEQMGQDVQNVRNVLVQTGTREN